MNPETFFANVDSKPVKPRFFKRLHVAFSGYAVAIGVIFSLGLAIHAFAMEQREASASMQERIAGEILRFHVVAHSDSVVDQALKRYVQVAVLQLVSDLTAGVEELEATRQVVADNLSHVVRYAQLVANRWASTADLSTNGGRVRTDVSGALSVRYFPQIQYANMWLPAGYYEALTLRIGSGAGGNWWCVMFPMLCFLDEQPTATPEMHAIMREVLSEEEYLALFEPVVEVRFRAVEMWRR